MPFKSEAQRRYMHANHPQIAQEFEAATPKGAKLPERVHPKPGAQHGHQHMDTHAKKALGHAGHGEY